MFKSRSIELHPCCLLCERIHNIVASNFVSLDPADNQIISLLHTRDQPALRSPLSCLAGQGVSDFIRSIARKESVSSQGCKISARQMPHCQIVRPLTVAKTSVKILCRFPIRTIVQRYACLPPHVVPLFVLYFLYGTGARFRWLPGGIAAR